MPRTSRVNRMPFRPQQEEISQVYNSGFVDVFDTADGAQIGYQPKIEASHVLRLCYEEQYLGINLVYLSRQNHAEIVKKIRVPKAPVRVFQLVRDQFGQWFEISLIQSADGVMPESLDISLKAVTADVEVQHEPNLV